MYSAGVNNITYANRGVNGGVTIVSRETFVSARPVAGNVVSVPARELAGAPVSRSVAIEPARSNVVVSSALVAKPPAAVTSRVVIAVRTPAATPGSYGQSQTQVGGHSNQQSPLVRQAVPGRPGTGTLPPQANEGFRSLGQPGSGTDQARTKPRVWEAEGTPEPESSTAASQSGNRNRPAQRSSHPVAMPVTPAQPGNSTQQREQVQKSSWQPRPAPVPAHPQQNSHPSTDSHATPPPKK